MQLTVTNLNIEHEKMLLTNVNLDLKGGDTVSICGPIGSGKTSLLRVLGLLDKPKKGGSIYIDNSVNCTSLPQPEIDVFINQYFAYVFQEFDLMEAWTTIENIALPLIARGETQEEIRKQVHYYCEQLGIADYAEKKVSILSSGTRKLVTLGRALAKEPKILIADEPVANLDPETREKVAIFLKNRAKKKNMIIIAAAHLEEIKTIFDKQYNIENDTLRLVYKRQYENQNKVTYKIQKKK